MKKDWLAVLTASLLALSGSRASSQTLNLDPAYSACGGSKANFTCGPNQVMTSFIVCGGDDPFCTGKNLPEYGFHSSTYKERLAAGHSTFDSVVKVPLLPASRTISGVLLIWPDVECMNRRGYVAMTLEPSGREVKVRTGPVPGDPHGDDPEWQKVQVTQYQTKWVPRPRSFTVYACVAYQ